MPLNAINNRSVPSENADKVSTGALPDEDVAVITSCCNVVVSVAKENGFLDVCVRVAVATESSGVVTDRLVGLTVWLLTTTVCGVMVACASIRNCGICYVDDGGGQSTEDERQ